TRTRSGWTISPNGERLLPAARMVALGSDAFTTGDSAQTGPEEWTILSPAGFAASVLTPACVRPLGDGDTVIRIVSAPSLAAREGTAFDAAIVRSRPSSSAVASRALADYEIGLYAHEDYLSVHGPIRSLDDLVGHVLAWYADDQTAGIHVCAAQRPQLTVPIRLQP